MEENILLVNKDDEVIGTDTKENCHLGDGILHRAITAFVFNNKNEILITKRSAGKKLWPGFWDATCSTHVHEGETYEQSGERRLMDELGFSCKLKFIFKFQYQVNYKDIGAENEICGIIVGNYNGEIKLNPEEISEYKWISMEQLKKEIDGEEVYCPWFKIAFYKYLELNE
jgi:isopentenyl-diphosphate Delta-isomerase